VTKPFIETVNWAKGLDAKGQPIPDPKKFPSPTACSSRPAQRSHQLAAPSYDPETGLFYVGTSRS